MSGNAEEKRFFYTGNSMAGTFLEGDELFTVRADVWHRGDVVLFRHHGKCIIHRVIKIAADGTLTTRGDNNLHDDREPVTDSSQPLLVVSARSAQGNSRTVSNGFRGLLVFLRKQFYRYLLWYLSKITPAILKNAPLRFLTDNRKWSAANFRGGIAVYYGNKAAAICKTGGATVFTGRFWKLFLSKEQIENTVREFCCRGNDRSQMTETVAEKKEQECGTQ